MSLETGSSCPYIRIVNKYGDPFLFSSRGTKAQHRVVLKTGPRHRLDNERDILRRLGSGREVLHIRQFVDEMVDPPCIVLEHLDDNLLDASNSAKLGSRDIKSVARTVLEALKAIHQLGYVHTGMLPILELSFNRTTLSRLLEEQSSDIDVLNCRFLVLDVKPDNVLVDYANGWSSPEPAAQGPAPAPSPGPVAAALLDDKVFAE